MQQFLVERRLRDVHARLLRAREELAVLDEQLQVIVEDAEDARIRSLVSETPLAAHDYTEARRHADALTRARVAMSVTVEDLERRQNELLAHVGGFVSAAQPVDSPAPSQHTRVVIAEDEAIIRLDLKEILVSAGYDVVGETGRGDEAVGLVEQHHPDLVILDVKMPGLDGVSAARQITGRHRTAVLVLTAFSQRDLIEEARDAGVAAYLVKPFRREELLPAVAEVMARCRQEWAIDEEVAAQHADEQAGSAAAAAAEDKIATRRVVEEAKALLIERHQMDEPAAFAFIQRTAMQTRARMRDVARKVVDGDLAP